MQIKQRIVVSPRVSLVMYTYECVFFETTVYYYTTVYRVHLLPVPQTVYCNFYPGPDPPWETSAARYSRDPRETTVYLGYSETARYVGRYSTLYCTCTFVFVMYFFCCARIRFSFFHRNPGLLYERVRGYYNNNTRII